MWKFREELDKKNKVLADKYAADKQAIVDDLNDRLSKEVEKINSEKNEAFKNFSPQYYYQHWLKTRLFHENHLLENDYTLYLNSIKDVVVTDPGGPASLYRGCVTVNTNGLSSRGNSEHNKIGRWHIITHFPKIKEGKEAVITIYLTTLSIRTIRVNYLYADYVACQLKNYSIK